MHVPVRVGGLVIFPDDLIHGDLNGIVTVPKDIAADVADASEEFVAAEHIILQVLRSGTATVADLRRAAAETDAAIDALRRRIAGR